MADTAFTSVQRVKQLLGLSVSTQDGQIEILVNGANLAFQNYLSRQIFSADYTEQRDGTGTGTLMFANYPVTAVASIQVGPPNTTRRTLTENVEYVWTSVAVQLLCGSFPRGVANVLLTYTAGFVLAPPDLVEKCTKLAALRFQELTRLGQSSKSMAGQTVQFDQKDWPADVKAVLDTYRKHIAVI